MHTTSKIAVLYLGMYAMLFTSPISSTETSVTNLKSQEKYDELQEPVDEIHNPRSVKSEELQFWTSNIQNELSELGYPVVYKYNDSPLQHERVVLEERDTKPAINLPLRFGRSPEDTVSKSIHNLPQRFGRYISERANVQSLANLPQRFGRSFTNGHSVKSTAAMPLRFGREIPLQRLRYEMNPHIPGLKNSEDDRTDYQV
ncbi:hypothetical protein GDO86_011711 [Hymenochirus boettgeri]|uniref:Uncharacterized protein n=1 Tax=Hymenochirus boettgeri TaxID=247094 RepID=A0A8T2JFC1_9PIPI|nr:hypothetical protein GDO86_011711 [Hymenochirus boettgeri]